MSQPLALTAYPEAVRAAALARYHLLRPHLEEGVPLSAGGPSPARAPGAIDRGPGLAHPAADHRLRPPPGAPGGRRPGLARPQLRDGVQYRPRNRSGPAGAGPGRPQSLPGDL